jgi:hypothetical protein
MVLALKRGRSGWFLHTLLLLLFLSPPTLTNGG